MFAAHAAVHHSQAQGPAMQARIAGETRMFAGHVGAALAIGRAERRINIGAFVFAALFLDVLLWLFVLLGWESAVIPADFPRSHQPQFIFPFSHGMLAGIGWSALAAIAVVIFCARLHERKSRGMVLMAVAVFSHWLLDALTHAPEMPLLGSGSPKIGLHLWDQMPVALAVEGGITALGVYLFLSGARLSSGKAIGIAVLCLALFVFTVVGMTAAPAPPSTSTMAGISLATLVIVCGLFVWLGNVPAGIWR
jgi:membrane-bound metal-dependent hydrolase YbcI (DUF457 family)